MALHLAVVKRNDKVLSGDSAPNSHLNLRAVRVNSALWSTSKGQSRRWEQRIVGLLENFGVRLAQAVRDGMRFSNQRNSKTIIPAITI